MAAESGGAGVDIATLALRVDAQGYVRTVDAATGSTQGLAAAGAQAEGSAGKLTPALGNVERAGTATERAVSRMSFSMTRMAESGALGGRSLMGLEMGLMRLIPGLGWVIAGAVAAVEVMNLLSKASENAGKAAEEEAKNYADFLGALAIKGPGASDSTKFIETQNEARSAQERLAKATNDVAVAEGNVDRLRMGPSGPYLENERTLIQLRQAVTAATSEATLAQHALDLANQALDAEYKADTNTLNERVARQRDLNDAVGDSKLQIEQLNVIEDARAQHVQNAIKYDADRAAAMNAEVDRLATLKLQYLDQVDALEQWTAAMKRSHDAMRHTQSYLDGLLNTLERMDTHRAEQHVFDQMAGINAQVIASIRGTYDPITSGGGLAKAEMGWLPGLPTPNDQVEIVRTMLHDMQREFSKFWDSVFEGGVNSFGQLEHAVFGLGEKMIADLTSANLTKAFKGLVNGQAGGGINMGALGSAALDIGAGAGLSLLNDALDNIFNGAARAAAALQKFNLDLESFKATISGDQLAQNIAAVHAQVAQLAQDAVDVWKSSGGNVVNNARDLRDRLAEINRLEAQRIDQLQKEARETAAANKNAIEQTREGYEQRLLVAQGLDDQAFALGQQMEYNKAMLDGADAATLAILKQTLLAEASRRTVNALQPTIDALTQFSSSLGTSALSPLSPAAQYALTRQQYETQLVLAQGGNATAAGQLPALAQAFLAASQAYNASSPAYAADYAAVQQQIAAVTAMFQGQLSDAERQLGILHDVATYTGGMMSSLGSIEQKTDTTNKSLQDQIVVLQTGFLTLKGAIDDLSDSVDAGTLATKRGLESLTRANAMLN